MFSRKFDIRIHIAWLIILVEDPWLCCFDLIPEHYFILVFSMRNQKALQTLRELTCRKKDEPERTKEMKGKTSSKKSHGNINKSQKECRVIAILLVEELFFCLASLPIHLSLTLRAHLGVILERALLAFCYCRYSVVFLSKCLFRKLDNIWI